MAVMAADGRVGKSERWSRGCGQYLHVDDFVGPEPATARARTSRRTRRRRGTQMGFMDAVRKLFIADGRVTTGSWR